MSRESLIFILGLLVLISPFVGVPRSVKDIALIIIGVCIMFFGFVLRRAAFLRSIENSGGERKDETFVEPARMRQVERNEEEHHAL